MKPKIKRIVSWAVGLVMTMEMMPFHGMTGYAICCRKDGFDKSRYTLTGNMAEDVATIAKSQKGRTCNDFGYSGVDYGFWCDEYVADCIENAGADSSIVGHGGTVGDFKSVMENKGAKTVTSPQAGDLVFFTDGSILCHVEIVTKVSDGVVYCAGGNNGSYPGECQGEHKAANQGTISSYLRPNYPDKKPIVSFYYNANGGTIADDSEYYQDSDGIIRRKSDDAGNLNNWDIDTRSDYGLYNASTMKLSRKNCEFLGWSMSKNSGTIYDQDDNTVTAETFFPDIRTQSGSVTFYAQWGGREMKESEGAGQTIPDGDYWIVNALSRGYLLDISGNNFNTENGKNLQMCQWDKNDWSNYDTFTITYLNNGFYSIKQRTTNMCFDADHGYLRHGTNVIMYECKNTVNQQWSIKNTKSGYILQNRANSLCLDVYGGKVQTDNNVDVWEENGTLSQYFSFVPYGAGQPVKSGTVCRIGTSRGTGVYINGAGNTEEYKNGTNVQIWGAGGDNYFRFEYLNNGFYKIVDNETGYALDIHTGGDSNYLTYSRNVQFYEQTGALEQEWALIPAATKGYYYIVSHMSGRVLDLSSGKTNNGNNIQVWSGFGKNQEWNIVTNKSFTVTPPTKTVYTLGEKMDTAGMKVILTYSDGYEHDVTSAAKVSCDLSSVGKKTATVTYENGGVKNTAKFEITVQEKETTTVTTTTTKPKTTTTTTTTTTKPTTTTTTTTSETTTFVFIVYGDMNDDNKIDVKDAVLMARLAGNDSTLKLSDTAKKAADVNGDNIIDTQDLQILLNRIVGKE